MPIPGHFLKKIKDDHKCEYFFETGFFKGGTMQHALTVGFKKCFTIELFTGFYNLGKDKFKQEINENKLLMINDDSANLSTHLALLENKKTCFWLDAHAGGETLGSAISQSKAGMCPIIHELQAIKSMSRDDNVILIDDVRLFKNQRFGIPLKDVEKLILDINNDYVISYVEGGSPGDVLYARIESKDNAT